MIFLPPDHPEKCSDKNMLQIEYEAIGDFWYFSRDFLRANTYFY